MRFSLKNQWSGKVGSGHAGAAPSASYVMGHPQGEPGWTISRVNACWKEIDECVNP